MSEHTDDDGEISTVKVTIYGEEYRVRADRHPERVRRLAEKVDRKMRAISDDAPRLSVSRVAVLAGLQLADELIEAERQAEQLTTMLQREWQGGGAGSGPEGAGGVRGGDHDAPADERQAAAAGDGRGDAERTADTAGRDPSS